MGEIEVQLDALARLEEQLVETNALRLATAETLRVATRRREEGYASRLDELLAERSLFAVERSLLQLRASRLQACVALYRALGGGWAS